MKKISLSLLLLVIISLQSQLCFSQNLATHFGNPNQLPSNYGKTLSIFGKGDKAFVIFSHGMGFFSSSEKSEIAPLNLSGYQVTSSQPFTFPVPDADGAGNTAQFLGFFKMEDNYVAFYRINYAKDKRAVVFAAELDFNGKWANKVRGVDTVLSKAFSGFRTDVNLTADSAHFIITEFPISLSKDEDSRTIFKLLDKDLNVVSNKKISLKDYAFSIADYIIVDRDNNLLMIPDMAAMFKKTEKQSIYVCNTGSSTISEIPIPLSGDDKKYIQSPDFIKDEKGNIYFTGRFGAKKEKSNGIFLFQVDANKKSFATKWIYNYGSDIQVLEKQKDFLHFSDLYNVENNCLFAVLNYDHEELIQSQHYTDTRYLCYGSMGFKIKPDGKTSNPFNVIMRQNMINDTRYIFSRIIRTDNNLYFIYNDKTKNLDVQDQDKLSDYAGSNYEVSPVCARVDIQTGKVSRGPLFTNSPEKKNPALDVSSFHQLEDNKYVVKADFESAGKFRFLEISLK